MALCLLVIRPDGLSQWLLVAGSAVVVVGYTNAFNFMDGINGISSLSVLVCGIWYAGLAYAYDFDGAATLGLAMAAAAVAFLPWNVPKAKIFLGDVGSYGLGVASVGLGLALWQHGAPLLAVLATVGDLCCRHGVGARQANSWAAGIGGRRTANTSTSGSLTVAGRTWRRPFSSRPSRWPSAQSGWWRGDDPGFWW